MSFVDYLDISKRNVFKQVKDYKLYEGLLGKGASGEVYLATDTKTNRLVAMKIISAIKLKNSKNMQTFEREIKALNDLKHDNIIKIESVQKTTNNIYMALEFCNGGTLGALKNYFLSKYNTGVPERLVQKIMRQIAEGLNYMHLKRVMHRDLKLENILLLFPDNLYRDSYEEYEKTDFEGLQVKIADLGYARDLTSEDCASTFCGTPLNIAPDILLSKEKGYEFKADMWSLGALTYELIISSPAFMAKVREKLFEKIKKGVYSYPKNCIISCEALTFINGLLTFNHKLRFDINDARKHPFLTNDPSTFHPLKLDLVPPEQMSKGAFEVNTKDINNFIWIMYKNYFLKEDKDVKKKVHISGEDHHDVLVKKINDEIQIKEIENQKQEEINNTDLLINWDSYSFVNIKDDNDNIIISLPKNLTIIQDYISS
jgi:serine/threonine protein kinase